MSSKENNLLNHYNAEPRNKLGRLLCEAAAKAVHQEDPWRKHDIPKVPAERIIRHLYHPESKTWSRDVTIVKIEKEPFTHGAMRFCYRMKMKATPPSSVDNHRFHSYGWSRASNFIAKAYMKDGEVDVSEEAKESIKNDITLQYESQFWAEKFNQSSPPKSIIFIRAYAIEFPDRPGQPMMAVERFISGKGAYGAGFIKHNTNSGYVDKELHRTTPQLFSAHSFYSSEGERCVLDMQGVGDLYTDPQVLSSDYRFGDGDLGPRGMALFFKTFEHSAASNAMGIPAFALSRNEIKSVIKNDQNSTAENGSAAEEEKENAGDDHDESIQRRLLDIDNNRLKRQILNIVVDDDKKATLKRSNRSFASIRDSMRSINKPILRRKTSAMVEVTMCLERSRHNLDSHSLTSGEADKVLYNDKKVERGIGKQRSMVRVVSAPMILTDLTKQNLGRVHYQLAVLHGMNRFPEDVHESDFQNEEDRPAHDVFSVLFHLSYAAALRNVPACLCLARVHSGLSTVVSDLLATIVPIDFDAAITLLRRAMESPSTASAPLAAAGCLLLQIYKDEAALNHKGSISESSRAQIIEDTLRFLDQTDKESSEKEQFSNRLGKQHKLMVDDRVEANYMLEGTFYSAVVTDVFDNGFVEVTYDDDGSSEKLQDKEVRLSIPPTATQTDLGGPLSDDAAFGGNGETDEKLLFQAYELKAELAELKEKAGDRASASTLFEEAADGAIAVGIMKTATNWSLRAADLRDD